MRAQQAINGEKKSEERQFEKKKKLVNINAKTANSAVQLFQNLHMKHV